MSAITHLAKLDVTVRTSSTSATVAEETNYTVAWSDLTTAGFGNGDDVLLIGRLSVGSDSISANPRGESRIGSTFAGAAVITGSDWLQEPQVGSTTNTGKHHVGWFKRVTLATDDNIYTAVGGDGTNAAYTGDFSLIVLKLGDLTENTDFLYNENATPITTAPTSYDTSGASVNVPTGGDDWLLLSYVQFTNDATNQVDFAALGFGGTAYDEISLGEEDTAEIMSWVTMRYAASVSSQTTLQALYYVTGSTSADIQISRVFALRLGAFRDHAGVEYDPGQNDVTLTAAGGTNWFEVAGLGTYAHGGSGANDLVLFAKSTRGTTSEAKMERIRIQIGGSDVLSSLGDCAIRNQNADDRPPCAIWGVSSQSNGTLDIDVDVQEHADVSPTLDMVNHTLVAFSAELATGATAQTDTDAATLASSESGSATVAGVGAAALGYAALAIAAAVVPVAETAALDEATTVTVAKTESDSAALTEVASVTVTTADGDTLTFTSASELAGGIIDKADTDAFTAVTSKIVLSQWGVAETATLSESGTGGSGTAAQTDTDAASLVDTGVVSASVADTDAGTLAESGVSGGAASQVDTDAATLADTGAGAAHATGLDSATLAEGQSLAGADTDAAVLSSGSAIAAAATATEAGSLADTGAVDITPAGTINKTDTDAFTLALSKVVFANWGTPETATLGEAAVAGEPTSGSLATDTVTLVYVNKPFRISVTPAVAETASLSESNSTAVDDGVSDATLGATGIVNASSTTVDGASLAESGSVTVSAGNTPKLDNDTATLADTAVVAVSHSETDAIALADTGARTVLGAQQKTDADAATLSESSVVAPTFSRLESAFLAETAAVEVHVVVTDTGAITSSVSIYSHAPGAITYYGEPIGSVAIDPHASGSATIDPHAAGTTSIAEAVGAVTIGV